jgi:hypothetical protein
MWFKGFNTRKATDAGNALADELLKARDKAGGRKSDRQGPAAQVQSFLAQVERDVVPLRLGMFQRAKLASSFKWRLLENGFEPAIVDELIRLMLVRLAARPASR